MRDQTPSGSDNAADRIGREEPVLSWCRQVGGGLLSHYLDAGGFAGAARACQLGTAGIIAELREAGLRDWTWGSEPVYQSWLRLGQSMGDRVLVVDARESDPRSAITATLLEQNPFGLVEALFIASLATGARWVRLLLSPGDSYLKPAFRVALGEAASHEVAPGHRVELSLESGEARPGGAEEPSLSHRQQIWYQLPLLFSRGAEWFKNQGVGSMAGTRLITVGAGGGQSRLIEVAAGLPLSQVLGWGSPDSPGPQGSFLALDQGLGGFLPREMAQTPLAPEELVLAGVDPGSSTFWIMPPNHCVVDLVRKALTELAGRGGYSDEVTHQLSLNALRLVTSIAMRRGDPSLVDQLNILADKLVSVGWPSGWPLKSSLMHFKEEWAAHANNQSCVTFDAHAPLVPPCRAGCPAGIDIPAFIALVGHGRYREAVEVIRRDNPLPYICGLVCPAPCKKVCLRSAIDAPISIRIMKAVAAQHCLDEGGYPKPAMDMDSGKKVAVIGSGPAGLSAAYFLALRGHRVEIFESHQVLGGTMRLGIPAYRLPHWIIDAEVNAIAELGVKMHTNMALGRDFTLDDLRAQGFDAAFLGTGATTGLRLGVEGEELAGVQSGVEFLKQASLGQADSPGETVVVLGGGNVAIDAARTALRLGSQKVTILYRRSRHEMPAHAEEVEEAVEEGVDIEYLVAPLGFEAVDGRVGAIKVISMKLGEPDAGGRRRPVPIEGSEHSLAIDGALLAIGQRPELSYFDSPDQIAVSGRGRLDVDPHSLQTSLQWVFAGGDAVVGPDTVINAVAMGKRAARSIDAYLKDKILELAFEHPAATVPVEPVGSTVQQRTNPARAVPVHLPAGQRVGSFDLAMQVIDDQAARSEAMRCLRCDLCIGCGLCQLACEEVGSDALVVRDSGMNRRVFADFKRAAERCVGCGSCANSCPTGAISIQDVGDTRRTVFTGTAIQELKLVPCSLCGRPFASQAYLDRLDSLLHRPNRPEAQRYICPVCVRQMRASKIRVSR